MVFELPFIADLLQHTTALDSSQCNYYSCDHSADYVGAGSNGENNLLGNGVIYPAQSANTAHTTVLDSSQCNYYSCDHSGDYVGHGSDGSDNLLGNGVIYPAQSANTAHTTVLDSTQCNYYSCDHSGDYVGHGSDGEHNLLGDGVIYPAQSANTAHTTVLSDANTNCTGYQCDNSADYVGTGSNGLLGDGVIYPAQSLCGVEHHGAYYCSDTTSDCNTTVTEPVLKPWPTVSSAAPGPHPMLYEAADHSGAYYCTEPEANCSTTIVDPVLKPLSAIAIVPPVESLSKTRPSPAAFVVCAHACLLGAAEATTKFAENPFQEGAFEAWQRSFIRNATANAEAVSPVGGLMLANTLAPEHRTIYL